MLREKMSGFSVLLFTIDKKKSCVAGVYSSPSTKLSNYIAQI